MSSGAGAARRQSTAFTKEAIAELMSGRTDALRSPQFRALMQALGTLSANPYSYTPETIAAQQQQAGYVARNNAANAMRQGVSSMRGGAANRMGMRAAMGMGDSLTGSYNDLFTKSSMQRPQDMMNLANLANLVYGTQFQWNKDIANAYTGGAAQQSQIASNSGPGIGSIFGSIVGSALGGPIGGAIAGPAVGAVTGGGG